jgi:phosphate transport system protein
MAETTQHIVTRYEQELKRLRDLLVEMGGLVEAQLASATLAVVEQDANAATRTVEQDPAVDALERIGDYAANVAKRSIVLSQFNLPFKLGGLAHMARLVQESLKLTVDAVGDEDAEKAIQVWRSDQAVDDIYTAIFRELVTYMMEDPRQITPCTHLLFIAKNLERIGDHATNIAETVHFAATGESLPEARPKGGSANYAVIRPRDEKHEA